MREIELYVEKILCAAKLAPEDSERVRCELMDHLLHECEYLRTQNITDEEIAARVIDRFGNSRELGRMIASAKGRFRTYMKKNAKALSIAVAAGMILLLLAGTVLAGTQDFITAGIAVLAV